ncbi:4'-phosphopantetheinyl transferase family protein [Belliella marina]|uniref:4'-phosphopantetheinyl transferase family protein n=1 Tax=Belliella marina TaxID=1644146 RepID=A0ABW4VQE4_9BACT
MQISLSCAEVVFENRPSIPGILANDEIQIWVIPSFPTMPHQELMELSRNSGFDALISPEDKFSIQKFVLDKGKNRKLMTILSRKLILADLLGIESSSLVIEIDIFGKPFLPTFRDVHFNVSHSGEFIVLAVGKVPVGIDLEFLDDYFDFYDMVGSIFQDTEKDKIKEDDKPVLKFFDFWTRKEAFLKAIGVGFRISPLDIKVAGKRNVFTLSKIKIDQTGWVCKSGQISPGYFCSLVHPDGVSSMEISIHYWKKFRNEINS